MKIGEASARSGCHVETIRYYERMGLLPAPVRNANGYREYSEDHVCRLIFVTRGRDLGFSLDEIRSLLGLAEDPALSCTDVDQLARAHLEEIELKIEQLNAMAGELRRTIAGCTGGIREHCAILHSLSECRPNPGERTRVDPHHLTD